MSKTPGTSFLLAFSNPVKGKEDEFNDWYTNVHIVEASAIEGFISTRRFKLSSAQLRDNQPYKYLAIYEIENGKEAAALENLKAAMPTFDMQPVIDLENSHMMVVESISDLLSNL
jgi:hypothetical protein